MSHEIGRRTLIGAASLAAASTLAANTAQAAPQRKIIAVSCSERKGKTTAAALRLCLGAAKEANPELETELIELAGLSIPAQLAAGQPLRPGEQDDFPNVAAKLGASNVAAIIVGSPVYFSNMSARCKAFLDRAITFRKEGWTLRNKVAAVLAVGGTRNGGQELTIQSIQAALQSQDMILAGTGKPSGRIGALLWNQGDSIEEDDFGTGTALDLGRRVAEIAEMLKQS